jgi:hypothetical protein
MTENNEMELIGTALQNFDRVAAGLALLEKNFKGVLYEVDTAMGMAHAKAARQSIRAPRYELEKIRKDAKAPLLALGKRLDSEATRITNALLVLENPIHEQIKNEEDRLEREKQERAQAEALRVAQIRARIDVIRAAPSAVAAKGSAAIQAILADYESKTIDESYAEFREEAATALTTTLLALRSLHDQAKEREAEAERIKAERLELAKLRAEQEARDRLAREAQAKADAEAKAERDAEAAAQAEANRLARAAIEREAAENRRIAAERQAEFDRQESIARQAREAQAKRQATAAAELAAREEALRKANDPKPRALGGRGVKGPQNPGRDAITQVLADHYSVDVGMIRRWLKEIDWESEAA